MFSFFKKKPAPPPAVVDAPAPAPAPVTPPPATPAPAEAAAPPAPATGGFGWLRNPFAAKPPASAPAPTLAPSVDAAPAQPAPVASPVAPPVQPAITVAKEAAPVPAMVDPRQLQQVVTVLVHNALVYGRLPGQTARIALHVHLDERGAPLLDVTDRGPGIPDQVATRLFSPFYTTSEHGTGLGLYIARELCLANQAHLAYVPVPAGGACFRIRLAGVRAIGTGVP